MSWESFDRPFLNVSGEDIPPFGVMELAGWTTDSHGLAVFNARKPTGGGKVFLINGPSGVPVPTSGHTGMGFGTRAHGAFALYDENLTPQVDQELGPVSGEWHLGDGSGFFVVGDVQGSDASPPGWFPPLPSSRRVRVIMQPSAPSDNIILGTVLSDVTANQPTFVIINIQVLEGPDPRTQPGNPNEGVLIQNVPGEVRPNGTVGKARKAPATGLWFPDLTASSAAEIYDGHLQTDLTINQSSIGVTVTAVPQVAPIGVGAAVVCENPVDPLRGTPQAPLYEHVGNEGGNCTFTKYAVGYRLLTVQPPLNRPVAP